MTQNSYSSLDEATREALALIEKETETKIEQLLQHVKGTCDSIRRNGANQRAKLPPEIRQVTAEEVCLTDKENFEELLKQLKPKKLSEFDTERM
ncbi:hypothetical protein G6F43_013777 [Rhizopus delemar]|nr:hypothetical protein G6F43_013777 [Rhizopus delemar]